MAKKILTIVGARPQFIKASALSNAINQNSHFEEVVVHTGQHFDERMSDVFFKELGMDTPKYNLDIHSMSHGAMTGRMMEALEKIMLQELPDIVVLYGDTNSTLAGALAAAKLHIKVAHIEAGLRSFNWQMPEEQNRVLTDRLSQCLFVPSKDAVNNLSKEGINLQNAEIQIVGDIMYDVFLQHQNNAKTQTSWLEELSLSSNNYFLASVHRQENVDDKERLTTIFRELDTLNEVTQVILPLHPRTKNSLKTHGISSSIKFIKPLPYIEMLSALLHCKAVLTDSGGLQKEAFYAKKICFTLRDETEWTELVDLGANILVTDLSQLAQVVSNVSTNNKVFASTPYGSGNSASKILEALRY